jgi:putative membrane protein
MKTLVWLLRIVIFILLFGLAVKNSGSIQLRFFLDMNWQWPLSLVLLATFAGGAVVGMSAGFATMVRQRREIGRLGRANSPAAPTRQS